MKFTHLLVLGVCAYAIFLWGIKYAAQNPDPPHNTCTWDVYFSPNGGCEQEIVNEIIDSKATIEVEAYEFTDIPIANALIAAKVLGRKVTVILDKKESSLKLLYSQLEKI